MVIRSSNNTSSVPRTMSRLFQRVLTPPWPRQCFALVLLFIPLYASLEQRVATGLQSKERVVVSDIWPVRSLLEVRISWAQFPWHATEASVCGGGCAIVTTHPVQWFDVETYANGI